MTTNGRPISLELTPDELHTLSVSTQGRRSNVAKVPKALLDKLIIDHGRLLRYAKDCYAVEGHT